MRRLPVLYPSQQLAAAAQVLASGGVVAFPTETVYGLGVDATNPAAVRALSALKGRDAGKPLQVMMQGLEQAKQYAEFSPDALRLAERFLPGALTLVLHRKKTAALASEVNPQGSTVGIRIPDDAAAQQLLECFGKPIAATSANRAGEAVVCTGHAVRELFGDALGYVLDGELPENALPSTVVDCSSGRPVILREGAISREAIDALF